VTKEEAVQFIGNRTDVVLVVKPVVKKVVDVFKLVGDAPF
jgi:hypothetical protein